MSDEVANEELPEIDEAVVGDEEKRLEASRGAAAGGDLGLIMEVPLRLSVEVGSATIPVRDVLALSKGSVVELDRMSGDPADVYVNDRLIARGELTVHEERVAIRVTELLAVKATTGGA
ncbi:MAG: flagellar motor switch protein FliN [Myxococcota bacterium]|nr:flagellar motor switch protein FliN [Myxococcales bacterium]